MRKSCSTAWLLEIRPLSTACGGQGRSLSARPACRNLPIIGLDYPSGGNGAVGGQGVNPLGPYPTYGSSSGSAISVAAHFAVASIGTETAGSLVAPAGVMSLVGMKPSAGLVSTEGVVPLIASNDGPGPIARTVQDAALLLAAADTAEVDYAAGLSADALTGVKVGVLLADIADAGMGTEAMTRTAAALVMLGADPAPVTLDVPMDVIQQFFVYLSAGMRYDMMPVVSAHNPSVVTLEDLIAYNRENPKRRMPFGQDLLEKFAPLTADLSAEDYAKLTTDVHTAMTEAMDAAFAAQGGVEVLVSMANLHSIFYATAGYPAITVPIGRTGEDRADGHADLGACHRRVSYSGVGWSCYDGTDLNLRLQMWSAARS